jgi:2-polyprenyl-3-methyl-5-hydroxy-6-metoxy-1,4-benzoquinol methylase
MFNPIDFVQFINDRIENCDNTLILGCGQGRHELELKGLKQCLGIDLCDWKLELCKQKIPVIKQDLNDLKLILDKSFDTVTMFDIVEHFNKENAYKLLKEAERIARKQIIMFIPIEETLLDNEEKLTQYQMSAKLKGEDMGYHLSLCKEQELKDLGYDTYYSKDFHNTFGACICIKKMV